LDDFFTRELWKNVPPTTADKWVSDYF
jgi:hypothetical protein